MMMMMMEDGCSNQPYDLELWSRCRNPKHKIFISHSGKQKDFAEQLCKDLESCNYSPFFDKRPDSLPKGEHFPTVIFKAAQECSIAIVLLSHDFAISKWPMMELATFVEAQEKHRYVQILPVLLGSLCPEDLNDTTIKNTWSQQYWSKLEEKDKHVTSDDISRWEIAIKALRPLNMILQSKYDGEVALRSEIVNAVLRLIPPDIRPDVSHVQGKEHLYQETISLFSSAESASPSNRVCNSAAIVGVYGIAGSGKSTLCMVLAHYLRGRLKSRVCHVDLGKEDMSTLNLQIKVLEKLTTVNHDYLHKYIKAEEEGWTCLMEHIPREKVFLALDNVSDNLESLEFARKFVDKIKYHVNSMLLVTSRSKDILHKHLGIPESRCMHCPHLTTTEALEIVLDHLNLNLQVEGLTKEQRDILVNLVKICDFGGHIHPMALKLLASQLGRNPSFWKLSNLSLLESSEKKHPLLASMEQCFKRLPDQQTKDMFMDITLFTPKTISNVHDMCHWLKATLHPSCSDLDSVRRKLDVLRLKSLLEVWRNDSDNVCTHDLHHQLARRMARVEDATDDKPPRFVYQIGCNVDPTKIVGKRLAERIERACLLGASCSALVFDGCSSLKLLSLRSCNNLTSLRIEGLGTLVSLELSACPLRTLNLKALISLRWLCLTSCQDLVELDASDCKSLARVYIFKCIQLEVLKLRNSVELESLSLSYNNRLQFVDLGSGKCLQCLALWFCEALTNVDMNGSVCLSEFKKRGCPLLMNVHGCNRISQNVSCLVLTRWHRILEEVTTGLQGSMFLQVLDLWDCPMSRLPDLRKCSRLRELKLTDVDVVLHTDNRKLVREYVDILCAADDELALPASLQEVAIVACRNTAVKEICWKLHGLTSLSVLSMQRVRVSWEWELYRSITKQYANTQSSSPSDLKISRNVLHEMIGLDEEITSTDSDEVICSESDELNFSAQMAQNNYPAISTSHERKMHSNVIEHLYHVIYWIHKFVGLHNHQSGNGGEVERIIKKYWQKLSSMQSLEEYEFEGEDWIRLVMSGEMEKVHYSSPEYVLLETFHNFDTQSEWWHEEEGRLFTIRQLRQQLFVVRALGPAHIHFFGWQPWEQKVLEEIFAFENMVESVENAKERMGWERYGGDGILFSSWRVSDLENRLLSLMKLRGWEGEELIEMDLAEMEQWKQEWLVSCKVCMSMQVLGIVVRDIAVEEDDLCWHRGWLNDMIQSMISFQMHQMSVRHKQDTWDDRIYQDSVRDKRDTRDDAIFSSWDIGRHLDVLPREWKAYKWLQKLAFTLCAKLVAADAEEKLLELDALKEEDSFSKCVEELYCRMRQLSGLPESIAADESWQIATLHPSNDSDEAAFYEVLHIAASSCMPSNGSPYKWPFN